MTVKLKKWDSSEHLTTEKDMEMYLETCIAEDDSQHLLLRRWA